MDNTISHDSAIALGESLNSAPWPSKPLALLPAQIGDHQLVARLDQVRRHAAAHAAGADESQMSAIVASLEIQVN